MNQARYEIKYVLNENTYSQCMNWLYLSTSLKKKYNTRQVNSIYFDDIFFEAARDNIIGMPSREKYRFRWYGDLTSQVSYITFERKIRKNRLNYKISTRLENFENNIFFLKNSIRKLILRGDLDKYLVPSIGVTYSRDYYEDHMGLRLTIDRDISFFEPNKLKYQNSAFNYHHRNIIMEIKFPPSLRNHSKEITKNLSISPSRHSKYLMGLSKSQNLLYI